MNKPLQNPFFPQDTRLSAAATSSSAGSTACSNQAADLAAWHGVSRADALVMHTREGNQSRRRSINTYLKFFRLSAARRIHRAAGATAITLCGCWAVCAAGLCTCSLNAASVHARFQVDFLPPGRCCPAACHAFPSVFRSLEPPHTLEHPTGAPRKGVGNFERGLPACAFLCSNLFTPLSCSVCSNWARHGTWCTMGHSWTQVDFQFTRCEWMLMMPSTNRYGSPCIVSWQPVNVS